MEVTGQRASLRLCSRSFHAFALKPEHPVDKWLSELDQWLARTPDFFDGKAIVLDVSHLTLKRSELFRLVVELNKRSVRILGVDSENPAHGDDGLPLLQSVRKSPTAADITDARKPQPSGNESSPSTLLIDRPIRSGQSIVNNDGDVIVIGSVASAAEIVSVGSIHVYGSLRGRALAGALGNRQARIFCRRMEAELIAIDGNYLLAEHMESNIRGNAIQAWLDGPVLKVASQD